jgi:hypothetical protein
MNLQMRFANRHSGNVSLPEALPVAVFTVNAVSCAVGHDRLTSCNVDLRTEVSPLSCDAVG